MGLRNSLPASPGGVSDHGALTGLADDDHSQYLNTTRHSAITGNPHGTVSADISDLAETIRDTIGTALVAGSNITLTVNDPGDTITVAATSTPATNERVKTNRYVVADSPATWSKESWCKTVRVQMWAPGGSGGGGSRTAAGANSRGGGGGSSGCVVDVMLPAEQVGSTETVTVGAVGAVGLGATTNGAAGGLAGSSSDCTFGSIVRAKCGLPGGGDSAAGAGVTNGGLFHATVVSSGGGGAGYNGASTQTLGTTTTRMTTSGGGGGGLSTANARVAGAAGGLMNGNLNTVFNTPTAAAGGSAVGANGGNGSVFAGMGFGGGGGAAGDTAGTVAGGNGGAGGFPGGGGGGGGGARNGANGGNGGLGGAGLVIITQYG